VSHAADPGIEEATLAQPDARERAHLRRESDRSVMLRIDICMIVRP
jgi:hypothetical protein